MQSPTSERALPQQHGVERAAARVHQVVDPRRTWTEIGEGQQQLYRAVVGHLLRDLGPAPAALNRIPLVWWSPTWGVLQAERGHWTPSGARLVAPVGFDRDLLIELPDDAVPMSPVQSCKPGKSLDDIRKHTEPQEEAA